MLQRCHPLLGSTKGQQHPEQRKQSSQIAGAPLWLRPASCICCFSHAIVRIKTVKRKPKYGSSINKPNSESDDSMKIKRKFVCLFLYVCLFVFLRFCLFLYVFCFSFFFLIVRSPTFAHSDFCMHSLFFLLLFHDSHRLPDAEYSFRHPKHLSRHRIAFLHRVQEIARI